jgi:hypothetical protein
MALGDSLDQAMQAQASQLLAPESRRDVAGRQPQQHDVGVPQVLIGKAACDEDEHHQRMQQRLALRVGKAQGRSTLPVNMARTLLVLKRVLAQCTVVAELLNLEHAPIGGKANAA